MIEIQINDTIFREYPTFRRGIVIATNIHNQGTDPELEGLLRNAVVEASRRSIDLNNDQRIKAWSEAYLQFGSNPNRFPPAHLALCKRVQKPSAHIGFINKVVAIMNYNSITDVIPVGGDDLACAGKCLELRKANGDETFVPLGSPEIVEHPNQGEIIYVVTESGDVMCRRWNWRNSHKTRITEETTAMVMNIDGLGDDSEARVILTRDRVAKMLEKFCHAQVVTTMLSPTNPVYLFSI
jgi:lysyl-tRNA synthetase class 2